MGGISIERYILALHLFYSFCLDTSGFASNEVLPLSNIKENLFQVAVDGLHAKKAMALVISNRESLLVLEVYNEARKIAHRKYAEALNNKELSWANARANLTKALLDARYKRDEREEIVFRIYIKALDDAELAFDKEAKAIDAPMP
jgi:hypothetical protein